MSRAAVALQKQISGHQQPGAPQCQGLAAIRGLRRQERAAWQSRLEQRGRRPLCHMQPMISHLFRLVGDPCGLSRQAVMAPAWGPGPQCSRVFFGWREGIAGMPNEARPTPTRAPVCACGCARARRPMSVGIACAAAKLPTVAAALRPHPLSRRGASAGFAGGIMDRGPLQACGRLPYGQSQECVSKRPGKSLRNKGLDKLCRSASRLGGPGRGQSGFDGPVGTKNEAGAHRATRSKWGAFPGFRPWDGHPEREHLGASLRVESRQADERGLGGLGVFGLRRASAACERVQITA